MIYSFIILITHSHDGNHRIDNFEWIIHRDLSQTGGWSELKMNAWRTSHRRSHWRTNFSFNEYKHAHTSTEKSKRKYRSTNRWLSNCIYFWHFEYPIASQCSVTCSSCISVSFKILNECIHQWMIRPIILCIAYLLCVFFLSPCVN